MNASTSHEASEALGLWEPKRTLTLAAARRHSQRIRLLRRCLLGLSALLIVLLIWQFTSQSTTVFEPDNPNESVRMVNPRYSGRTDDGLPYFLTAAEAIRTTTNAEVVELVKPVLHFFREEGADESTILAESGSYDDVNKVLNLRTTVNLRTDDGNHCVSTHARIYAKTKIVEGDEPIHCEGSFGIVNGNAYDILENYTVFVFKNGMDAVLDQDENALAPETSPAENAGTGEQP